MAGVEAFKYTNGAKRYGAGLTVDPNAPAANWKVVWLKGPVKYQRVFGQDLCDALAFYDKVKAAGRKGATLVCTNKAWAAPERFGAQEYYEIEERVAKIRGKKKRVKVKVKKTRNIMGELNLKGAYWCPYCMKLRKFRKCTDASRQGQLECPICEISTADWYVRMNNPQAAMLAFRGQRRRSSGKSRNGKRRGTRRRTR